MVELMLNNKVNNKRSRKIHDVIFFQTIPSGVPLEKMRKLLRINHRGIV